MQTIEKRDLIEALKPFNDIDRVLLEIPGIEFGRAEKHYRELELALEESSGIENCDDLDDSEKVKQLAAIVERIQFAANKFGPLWEDICNDPNAGEIKIIGVECKGNQAIIIAGN